MKQLSGPQFSATVPDDWIDVTAELEDPDAPTTFARDEGEGALQVSVALYQSGGYPNATEETVVGLLEDFAARQSSEPLSRARESSPLKLASASFRLDPKVKPKTDKKRRGKARDEEAAEYEKPASYLKVWYLSDGGSFAFATYTCEFGEQGPEVDACDQIVRTLQFLGAAPPPAAPSVAPPSPAEQAPPADPPPAP